MAKKVKLVLIAKIIKTKKKVWELVYVLGIKFKQKVAVIFLNTSKNTYYKPVS
jgi:hypothetical protein